MENALLEVEERKSIPNKNKRKIYCNNIYSIKNFVLQISSSKLLKNTKYTLSIKYFMFKINYILSFYDF